RPWPESPIRRVGLTGSIATGKSLAAAAFARLGITVVDADALARKVVAAGSDALREVEEAFGPSVLAPDGTLDRAAMGKLVFADPEARRRLEAIVHPRVAAAAEAEMSAALSRDPVGFVVYDLPLLFEAGLEEGFDLIVVVSAGPGEQRRRLALRDNLPPAEIERRIASQKPLADKEESAHVVLENRGNPGELERAVGDLAAAIRRHNAARAKKGRSERG
ncbi:MAG TPA: dephospho-CoA kinase, partial [Geobacteraceae bacterium]